MISTIVILYFDIKWYIFLKILKKEKRKLVLPKFRTGGIFPDPQGMTHGGETNTGSHNRGDFWLLLNQPLRDEIVFRLARDI